MEADIPPKSYRHPDEPFKNLWLVLVIVGVPDVLRNVWSMNVWLAEIIGLACALAVMAFHPPRLMKLSKLALLSALMCSIVAVQYLVHSFFHLHH
jgi:hypothetical protein